MSMTLFKTTLKNNWFLFLIFIGVLTMYLSVMISMYDPDDILALTNMMEMMPADFVKALNFAGTPTGLSDYLANFLYGLLMFAFPMVYCIILGNKLVAKLVDNGSFAYLLSTPNSRNKIIITQGIYALLSIVVMFLFIFTMGVLISETMFKGALDIKNFFRLNVTTMLVNTTVLMICFFFSCLFNDSKKALGFGAGIPIAFLLLQMLGGSSDNIKILKDISIYGFYDPVAVVLGTEVLSVNIIYIIITSALFIASIFVFNKKRLPL